MSAEGKVIQTEGLYDCGCGAVKGTCGQVTTRIGVCAEGREVVLEGGLDPGERGLKALESPTWKKSTTRQSLISDSVH